ncbi:MAG: DUF115 domain-containing protein [Deltaproteobacteria bacterium]|nr:DUF115 domain-containing protein [Deltaproteobacteria bacterium]
MKGRGRRARDEGRSGVGLVVRRAANGSLTGGYRLPDGREILLHSAVDPEDEARFLVKNVRPAERTLYVVLGFGMGYHVREILRRIPDTSRVVVVEPARTVISRAALEVLEKERRRWFRDRRLILQNHHDPATAPLFLADTFARHRLLGLNLYTHIPTACTDETFYRRLLGLVPERFPGALQAHLAQYEGLLENDLTNFWANLPVSWECPHVSFLSGSLKGMPALVVGAGPSLTEDLDAVKAAKGRALILCVATAAPVLMKHGVVPDLVVSIDPNEANMAHFEGWDTAASPLVYYHRIWRGVLSVYKGGKFWFTMEDEPLPPHAGHVGRAPFRRGGSVTFTALQLAHYMKARIVALVGVDLAFHGGRTHAEGAAYCQTLGGSDLPQGYFRVPATFGGQVATNETYYAFLRYLEDFIRREPRVLHVNTARHGARIGATQEMGLSEFLERFCGPGGGMAWKPPQAPRKVSSPKTALRRIEAVDRWARDADRFARSFQDEERVDAVIRAFRGLSLYRAMERSYEDCFYLWEIQARGEGGMRGTAPRARRLLAHAREVSGSLGRTARRLEASAVSDPGTGTGGPRQGDT